VFFFVGVSILAAILAPRCDEAVGKEPLEMGHGNG